tara:strand:- start:12541 stop:12819 length:279 start_codon:yes stop_codon:yes gene_type:complete
MKKRTINSFWKIALVLTAAFGISSCETVDKGKEKWDGMSKKDQSTIIGGLGGAVVGSVVTGKKATGAILGGVAGAVGGRVWNEKKNSSDLAE